MLKMAQRFINVAKINSNNGTKVALYRSELSGVRVAIVDHPSPVVSGWFSFSTKATTDDGLPHTLEHLVFMGSKKHPYKGFLDCIANRCMASGTNGYTDEDHTAYSISTVGTDGFVQILPVYLDHLLNPLLTPEHYTTEIHHINGEGKDGGVVYAEMQDHEQDMDELIDLKKRHITSEDGTPYRAVYGGSLPGLRELCSLERVKAFHKQHYTLTNMILTVVGKIDHERVLSTLAKFEAELGYKEPVKTVARPFDDVVLPEKYEHQIVRIRCPVEDDTNGTMLMVWQGPEFENPDNVALPVLLNYLCGGAESPLEQTYVQAKDSICSSISREFRERPRMEFGFRFGGIKEEYLKNDDLFNKKAVEVIRNHKIDLDRMRAIIEQNILKIGVYLEGNPTDYYHGLFSVYQLYAPGVSSTSDNVEFLTRQLNGTKLLEELKGKDEAFWNNLISKYFTEDRVLVFGEPDAELVDTLAKREKDRIQAQVERLGKDGLAKAADVLAKAVAANEASAPNKEALREFSSHMEGVDFIQVNRSTQHPAGFPFPTVTHEVEGNFVYASVVYDIADIPLKYRSLIQVFTELLPESNALIDGKVVTYEELSTLIKKDVVDYKISLGVKKAHQHLLTFTFAVEPKNYDKIAYWTNIFLNNIIFENSRIAVTANRLLGSASELLHDGYSIADELFQQMMHPPQSTERYNVLLATTKLNKDVAKITHEGKDDVVVNAMKKLSELIVASPVNLHLIGSKSVLDKCLQQGWQSARDVPATKSDLRGNRSLSYDYSIGLGKTYVIPYGGSESSFLLQRLPLPLGYLDTRSVYAKLLAQYFSQCEGPLWNHVRGNGLAYGVSVYVSTCEGLQFYIYRAADFEKAYTASKKVIMDTIESRKIDADQFDAAKRSLISEIVQAVGYVRSAGKFSVLEYVRGVPNDVDRIQSQISTIWAADPDTVLNEVAQSFADLFVDDKILRAVVVYKTNTDKVKNYFHNTEVKSVEDLYVDNVLF